MTVGFYAPLPPARTGVADYARSLLSALRRRGTVRLRSSEADVCLYHLGNNQLHREIYARALKRPGVAVLHDAVLHHLFLGALSRDAYLEEFVYNYGDWSRQLAEELWRGRARSGADHRYFRYSMLRRIAEVSRGVIVHNPAGARIVFAHAPEARVFEVPHLFAPAGLPSPPELVRFRQRWELAPGAFVFGVFGYLRESKRLGAILRAFRTVRRRNPDTALLVAGEFVSADLARALAPLLAQPGVVMARRTPEAIFSRLTAAVDACVNLRYPAAGETSGIVIRLMGLGKPVILTAGEENSRFPEDACVRIEAGIGEEEALVETMTWLVRFPEAAREIGRRAAAHVREKHSLEAAAGRYWEVLQACRG